MALLGLAARVSEDVRWGPLAQPGLGEFFDSLKIGLADGIGVFGDM